MKKATRIWLHVACSMLVLGLILAVIGKSLGGSRQVERWILNGDFSFGPMHFFGWDIDFDDIELDRDQQIYSGDMEMTRVLSEEKITDLAIEIGGAKLKLVRSEDDSFYFASQNAMRYQCYVKGSTLYIKSGTSDWNRESEIVLYIPEGWNFDKASVTLGGGEIVVGGLHAQSVTMEVGAGKVEMAALEAEHFQVEIGAGQVTLSDVTVQEAELEVGMGQLLFEGSVVRDMHADCAMGSMVFTMHEKEEDHNYKLECAMGSLKIGGSSYAGFASERHIDNHADYTYELTCSMGEIKMTFQ